MSKRRSSLTGSWSGAFRYPRDAFPETVFNAQIEENDAGAFTGSIQEANILRPHLGPVVTSAMQGAREGAALTYMKIYSGDGGMGHMVAYDGSVDDSFQRIEGVWNLPGSWSGTFWMVRDDLGEAAEADAAIEKPIEVRR